MEVKRDRDLFFAKVERNKKAGSLVESLNNIFEVPQAQLSLIFLTPHYLPP